MHLLKKISVKTFHFSVIRFFGNLYGLYKGYITYILKGEK